MREIDIRELLFLFERKLKWILLVMVLGAVLAGLYTNYLVEPTYSTSFTMYISNITKKTDDIQNISSSNLSTSAQLVEEYSAILKNDAILLDEVVAELKKDGIEMEASAVRKSFSTASVNETAIMRVTATTAKGPSDKGNRLDLSQAICKAIATVAPKRLVEFMDGMGKVTVMSEPAPSVQTGPNLVRNVAIGAAAGIILTYGLFLVLYLTDNTISTEREFKNRLGDFTLLGSVPSMDQKSKGAKYSYD